MTTGFIFGGLVFLAGVVHAAPTLKVYGPGGPAPAMKKCAAAFEKSSKTKVEVTAGPLEKWSADAPTADLFYSGSENMMDSFADKIPQLDAQTIRTHYLRPSAILVRPGNPLKITGIKDLTDRKMKVMVVNGAGQVGMWEDIVGRLQSVKALNQFRSNIVVASKNTGEAEKRWNEDKTIEAWLVFNIWGTRSPESAQIVATEPEVTIYRSMGTALSKTTQQKKISSDFIAFIEGSECQAIFKKEGWN